MIELTIYCARCHAELSVESYGPHNVNVQPCDCQDVNRALLEACEDMLDYIDVENLTMQVKYRQWKTAIQLAKGDTDD